MQTTRGTPLTAGQPPTARASEPRRRIGVLVTAATLVFAADLVSKVLVVAMLEDQPPVRVLDGVLRLVVARNAGAAFSIGTGATALFTVVAVGVIVVIVRTAPRLRSAPWALVLGMLLGGAVGNLADRLFRSPGFPSGHVVDWIELPHWPVFNIADSAIVVGGIIAVVLAARGIGLDGRRESDRPLEQGTAGPGDGDGG